MRSRACARCVPREGGRNVCTRRFGAQEMRVRGRVTRHPFTPIRTHADTAPRTVPSRAGPQRRHAHAMPHASCTSFDHTRLGGMCSYFCAERPRVCERRPDETHHRARMIHMCARAPACHNRRIKGMFMSHGVVRACTRPHTRPRAVVTRHVHSHTFTRAHPVSWSTPYRVCTARALNPRATATRTILKDTMCCELAAKSQSGTRTRAARGMRAEAFILLEKS